MLASGYVMLKTGYGQLYACRKKTRQGAVQCGTITPGWYSAMWTLATATDGWSYIRDRWQTSEWSILKDPSGLCTMQPNVQNGWYSAVWKLVNPVTAPSSVTTGVLEWLQPVNRMQYRPTRPCISQSGGRYSILCGCNSGLPVMNRLLL